jgi:hydroxyacid-oxoacid transhydrogenase
MSYPISGLCKVLPAVAAAAAARPYASAPHALIPHGVSVALAAPAVFRATGSCAPERHRAAAEALGIDVSRCASADGEHAGALLAAWLVALLDRLGAPAGLAAAGFRGESIPALVVGTLPQERVTRLAPLPVTRELLESLFADSMHFR